MCVCVCVCVRLKPAVRVKVNAQLTFSAILVEVAKAVFALSRNRIVLLLVLRRHCVFVSSHRKSSLNIELIDYTRKKQRYTSPQHPFPKPVIWFFFSTKNGRHFFFSPVTSKTITQPFFVYLFI